MEEAKVRAGEEMAAAGEARRAGIQEEMRQQEEVILVSTIITTVITIAIATITITITITTTITITITIRRWSGDWRWSVLSWRHSCRTKKMRSSVRSRESRRSEQHSSAKKWKRASRRRHKGPNCSLYVYIFAHQA
jgi:hypothetical protein